LVALAALASWGPAACAAPSHPAAEAVQPASQAASFPADDGQYPHYRSRRLSLTLSLPDGRAWRIDDHSAPELVATHAPTRSRLVVSVFSANELVGRTQCEELARSRHLVPESDPKSEHVIEDQVAITQQTFDTRIEVLLEPGNGPDRALGGRVLAFGGFLRKCYAFVYSTDVDSASDEAVLSSRLAVVRARVLGGLELEPFDSVPRESPDGPKLAPGP
jgi:hypothetical protein